MNGSCWNGLNCSDDACSWTEIRINFRINFQRNFRRHTYKRVTEQNRLEANSFFVESWKLEILDENWFAWWNDKVEILEFGPHLA